MCVFKKMFDQSFFPSKKLQPYTFWEKFSHAHVNEFDDCSAPSHCKTIGFIFRKWIGMGKPKELINHLGLPMQIHFLEINPNVLQ